MKFSTIRHLAVVAAVLLLGKPASAVPVTFFDDQQPDDPIKFLTTSNGSNHSSSKYTSFFDLTAGTGGYTAFDPNDFVITNAVAKFYFADDGDSNLEYVQIKLANSSSEITSAPIFIGPIEVDGTHNNIPTSYDLHFNTLKSEDLASLNGDGIIWFSVQAVKYQSGGQWKNSDTYLKRAELWAYGNEIPDIVTMPDGGTTSLLLAGSFLGLCAVRAVRSRLQSAVTN